MRTMLLLLMMMKRRIIETAQPACQLTHLALVYTWYQIYSLFTPERHKVGEEGRGDFRPCFKYEDSFPISSLPPSPHKHDNDSTTFHYTSSSSPSL